MPTARASTGRRWPRVRGLLWVWPLLLSIALHAALLLGSAKADGPLRAGLAGPPASPAPPVWRMRLLPAASAADAVAARPMADVVAEADAAATAALARPPSPPEEVNEPAPLAERHPPQAGAGFDVAPVPREGWVVDTSALLALPPGPQAPLARLDVEVDVDGVIVRWHLVDTNTDVQAMLQALDGLQHTLMVPARRAGQAVAARFFVELVFSE